MLSDRIGSDLQTFSRGHCPLFQNGSTVAFGYPRERSFEQRVPGAGPLAIRDMRRL